MAIRRFLLAVFYFFQLLTKPIITCTIYHTKTIGIIIYKIFHLQKNGGFIVTKSFSSTAYTNLNDFVYGKSIYPVTCKNGMIIGGGDIYPELNFTLPSMLITQESMPEVVAQYREIITGACERARELFSSPFVAEIELLPPTTYNPQWGIEIAKNVRDIMWEYEQKFGLKSALRITPADIREDSNSEHMWRGKYWEAIMETFEGSAKAGADFLAIESIGGKDVHDDAVMFCDINKALFALGILGARDMAKLWSEISSIAGRTGSKASGDTACGFANTAMVLADKGYVPRVFSAVIRVMTAVRSLVAVENGAVGPHKDCGYEGVYVKAISGIPIAMEGKSSACAHLSCVGNIAGCVADLWSNESVQNIKLLSGMAPTVSMEQLIYDCRLMNEATKRGDAARLMMRDLLADSDSKLDPQAYVLRPDVVLELSKELVKYDDHFSRTKAAALLTIDRLRKAIQNKELTIPEREDSWLDNMEAQLDAVPDSEQQFIDEMLAGNTSEKFIPAKYDL
jgi:methanol--5-hydroxybenzimidazolylcobamide Co-methyltransferase